MAHKKSVGVVKKVDRSPTQHKERSFTNCPHCGDRMKAHKLSKHVCAPGKRKAYKEALASGGPVPKKAEAVTV